MDTIAHSLKPSALLKGRYRIEAVLGEGGFGITYKAHDERLERVVVIKEYLPTEMGARAGGSVTIKPRTDRDRNHHDRCGSLSLTSILRIEVAFVP